MSVHRVVQIVVLCGVSGSGKTTLGKRLADRLVWPFFDGDDFHPPENIAKMSQAIPLTDADRMPWLERLADLIETCLADGISAVIACSALRQSYRDRLARGHGEVLFVYLKGSRELIAERLETRAGHFMPGSLLDSQFDALEEPVDGLTVEIGETPEAAVTQILACLARPPPEAL